MQSCFSLGLKEFANTVVFYILQILMETDGGLWYNRVRITYNKTFYFGEIFMILSWS